MRQNSNPQSKAVVCMCGVQWVLDAVFRGSRASTVAGVAKARVEPMRATALLILSLVAGPVNAQAPELPPCDPGVQGDPGFDIPNRPAASSAQCASFRASAEIRPAAAAATLLDHASTWVDYFAEEAALYPGGYGRYNELLWADRVAQLAKCPKHNAFMRRRPRAPCGPVPPSPESVRPTSSRRTAGGSRCGSRCTASGTIRGGRRSGRRRGGSASASAC